MRSWQGCAQSFDDEVDASVSGKRPRRCVRYYKIEAGTGVAGRFLNEFERVARHLESNPGFGTPTGEGRRWFPLRAYPYSVIYRETGTGIRILVVRHQSREPSFGDERT
jgi:plasmid stabilization system protein ParE